MEMLENEILKIIECLGGLGADRQFLEWFIKEVRDSHLPDESFSVKECQAVVSAADKLLSALDQVGINKDEDTFLIQLKNIKFIFETSPDAFIRKTKLPPYPFWFSSLSRPRSPKRLRRRGPQVSYPKLYLLIPCLAVYNYCFTGNRQWGLIDRLAAMLHSDLKFDSARWWKDRLKNKKNRQPNTNDKARELIIESFMKFFEYQELQGKDLSESLTQQTRQNPLTIKTRKRRSPESKRFLRVLQLMAPEFAKNPLLHYGTVKSGTKIAERTILEGNAP